MALLANRQFGIVPRHPGPVVFRGLSLQQNLLVGVEWPRHRWDGSNGADFFRFARQQLVEEVSSHQQLSITLGPLSRRRRAGHAYELQWGLRHLIVVAEMREERQLL